MTRFAFPLLAATAFALAASPSLAQKKSAARSKAKPAVTKVAEPAIPPVCPLPGGEIPVRLATSLGTVDVALDAKRAPVSTANFLAYTDSRKYDGASFYRVMKMPGDAAATPGLVQAGQRTPGMILPPIAHEPTTQTGLSHVTGAISMARLAPGTATSDFFIMTSDMKGLDADPARAGDNAGYAVFGHVTSGMEIVRQIYGLPIDPAKGPMVGQMIAEPVKITSARRIPLRKADDPACAAARP